MNFSGGVSGVSPEQQRLLKSNSHGFGQLTSSGRPAPLEFLQLLTLPLLIFGFTVFCLCSSLRYQNEAVLDHVLLYGVILLLAVPTVTLLVFVVGIVLSRQRTLVSWPAVVYWGYWPFWKAALCWAALYASCQLGNHVWSAYLLPSMQLADMQVYKNIDPAEVSGVRLQDAGVVDFSQSTGVDRTKGSCLRNGAVYCIAPIVVGGEFNTSKTSGVQDLFMAGKDCCSCSGETVGEFRCGDWSKPISATGYAKQIGGLRVVNQVDADFYRLAAQDWSATFQKEVNHAIFFDWVDGPALTLEESRTHGQRVLAGAVLLAPLALMAAALALRGGFAYLRYTGNAVPTGAPIPVGTGLPEKVNQHLLPEMHADNLERQAQMSGEAMRYSVL